MYPKSGTDIVSHLESEKLNHLLAQANNWNEYNNKFADHKQTKEACRIEFFKKIKMLRSSNPYGCNHFSATKVTVYFTKQENNLNVWEKKIEGGGKIIIFTIES